MVPCFFDRQACDKSSNFPMTYVELWLLHNLKVGDLKVISFGAALVLLVPFMEIQA